MRDVSPGVQVIENWAEACSSSGVMGLFRQAGVPVFPFLPRIVRISFLPWLQLDKVRKALGSHWCWVLTAMAHHIHEQGLVCWYEPPRRKRTHAYSSHTGDTSGISCSRTLKPQKWVFLVRSGSKYSLAPTGKNKTKNHP